MTQTRISAPFDPTPALEVARPSLLDRVLGIVTEVRAGEGLTALLLATALLLLLMAYYMIKPLREALILQHPGGAEYKSWLGAAIAVLLLFVVPAYSKLADRLPRNRLVSGVTLFFGAHMALFYVASVTPGLRESLILAVVFFVWIGIFNMMVVAQLWAFANDIYDQERGKRLFVIVGLGSFGAVVGSAANAALSRVMDMFALLLVSAAALGGVALIVQFVHRREKAAARRTEAPQMGEAPPRLGDGHDASGAFALVMHHRYLLLIAGFSLVFSFVNTNGEYMLSKLVQATAAAKVTAGTLRADELRSFIGDRYNTLSIAVNIISFVLQSLVVSRLLKRVGFGPAFFIFPFIALLDGVAVAIAPVLGVLFIGKIAENSADYSLNNTLRNMLWLPTTREMKYKAKQAVDTFFVRMGDVASGAWVVIGAGVLGVGVRGFALTNVGLAGVWLWLALMIVREQRQLDVADPGAPSP
jgi:ATP:ADP antiporter, AAA family